MLFSAMPTDADPGMAFVLVQHLPPDHESVLPELVQPYTSLQVVEIENGMALYPDSVYIAPANRDIAIVNSTFQLFELGEQTRHRQSLDFFFISLAQDQHERAICIVLSGAGSDGASGVRAIKEMGGMVMVQDPESSNHDGMPRSAIATGMVDYVLPPAEMPAKILAYAAHSIKKPVNHDLSPARKPQDSLIKIFALLRIETGHDFSHYKHSTVERRIGRRMTAHQITHLEEYVRYLQQDPAEIETLFLDLLIGVTSFFRDPRAFDALGKEIIPRLLAGKPAGASIRVWVPGCSTGEEAYSIAMLLHEEALALKRHFNVQVFATDIDSRAIEQARSGRYPASIAASISPERLARHFNLEPNGTSYRITKEIREMLIFSRHDILKHSPFSKLDLISCRNLLIYLDAELQKTLIPLFHYALNPGGFLFLGSSESVGDFGDLFSTLNRKALLYERKDGVPHVRRSTVRRFLRSTHESSIQPSPKSALAGKLSMRELVERALLQHLAPVGILVNERGDILFLSGRTGQYLEPAQGEAGINILAMAREGLQRDLTIALHKAIKHGEPVRQPGLQVKTNGHFTTVDLTVRPISKPPDSSLFLVVLEKVSATVSKGKGAVESIEGSEGGTEDVDARIAALKRALRSKEEYLENTNEELRASNEEMQGVNEEMQSVNEELKSINEELETSKEELQSVNEELATVNAELTVKVADLSQANNDLNNLLAGTGTIFVDHEQIIQRFTPAAAQVINLIPNDVGRPVSHIGSNLASYNRLMEDVQEVLDTLDPKEIEVQTKTGAWFSLGIRPYRTVENVIAGAVISFSDITELKKAQAAAQNAGDLCRLGMVVRDSKNAITVQDLVGRILAFNLAAQRLYGWSETEAVQMNFCDMFPKTRRKGALNTIKRLSKTGVFEPHLLQKLTKDGRVVNVWATATELTNDFLDPYAFVITEQLCEDPG